MAVRGESLVDEAGEHGQLELARAVDPREPARWRYDLAVVERLR
jgi:hypothetical protein